MAADRGVPVSLLCASRGEGRGQAGARTEELHAAARILGITNVAVLDYEDGMLPWVDANALERDIRDAIRRTRATVVVTFGEDGLYWHPDHIAIYERTTAAVVALGHDAPALYYVTMPPGQMRRVMDAAVANAASGTANAVAPRLILGIDNPDAFGADAPVPTAIVDISAAAARKLAAIKAHASQLRDDAFAALTEDDAIRLLGVEHLHRAPVGAPGETFIESLAS